jgi:hypothetical protein
VKQIKKTRTSLNHLAGRRPALTELSEKELRYPIGGLGFSTCGPCGDDCDRSEV